MTIKECTKEDLLDIIKSKDAEIEQLKRDLGQCENLYKQQMHYLQYQLGEAKMEVERLEEANRILRKEIKTMHDKASKKIEKYRCKCYVSVPNIYDLQAIFLNSKTNIVPGKCHSVFPFWVIVIRWSWIKP